MTYYDDPTSTTVGRMRLSYDRHDVAKYDPDRRPSVGAVIAARLYAERVGYDTSETTYTTTTRGPIVEVTITRPATDEDYDTDTTTTTR